MSDTQQAEVKSSDTGHWQVVVSNEASGRYVRARDAEVAARRMVRNSGGGEVVIHSRSGRIKDVRTVPGSDPASSASNGKN